MVLFALVLLSIGLFMLAVGASMECGERRVTLAFDSIWEEPFDWGTLLTPLFGFGAREPAPAPPPREPTRCERAPSPRPRPVGHVSAPSPLAAMRERLLADARIAAREGDMPLARSLRGQAGFLTRQMRIMKEAA